MNKGELLEKVAKDCSITKTNADRILSSIISAITGAVSTGEKVTLIDFGTFSSTERVAREGRNPKTGEKIAIPAKRVVKFKAGSKLSGHLN